MTASGPLGEYLAQRTRLIADAAPGLPAARSLSALTDDAIRHRAQEASSAARAPFALFALGGYGAGRLLPNSDIDLLVVSRGNAAQLDPLIRSVLYPLWDAGLTVGHQVRSPKAQLAAVREDFRNATGFMTARFVAGDEALGARTLADTFGRFRSDARSLRRQLLDRERPGSPYLLEPDLKDGAGGQRDLDEMLWHAAVQAGRPCTSLEPLAEAGLLTAAEVARMAEAQDIITAARWVVHRADPRSGNLLSLDAADLPGIDAALLQHSLVTVDLTLATLRDRVAGGSATPPAGLTLAGLRTISSAGGAGLEMTERRLSMGAADAAVPGFSDLMALRRPGLSHRYTVGAHSLRTLTAISAELDALGEKRVPSALRDAALVAALAHDAGKAEPMPDHATRGAGTARAAALFLGLEPWQAEAAAQLVAQHLLLSDTVAHTDLSDEDAILAVAARVADAALVAPLFALTAADMRSTGDGVWNAWREVMLSDLAARLEDALSPEVDGAGIVQAALGTRAEAMRTAHSIGASASVIDFLKSAPLRYLARRDAEGVLRDARLVRSIAGPGAPGRFTFAVSTGPAEGTWLIDIVTRDRPGLFASISGALALAGLDVLSAEAHTDRSDIALDTFVVTSATLAPVGTATWSTFDRLLGGALAGHLDLDVRLAERRRHYAARTHANLPPVIEVGARGTFTTPVRVRASDRVGLLHDLARVFETEYLDIRRASVTTLSGVVTDVFDVTDAHGDPPEHSDLRTRLVPRLEMAAGEQLNATGTP